MTVTNSALEAILMAATYLFSSGTAVVAVLNWQMALRARARDRARSYPKFPVSIPPLEPFPEEAELAQAGIYQITVILLWLSSAMAGLAIVHAVLTFERLHGTLP
jgi:hypothetical protein